METVPGKMDDYVHIDVQDTELCPRYCARLIRNVKIGPSPMWMRKALNAAGVRAINNIVDITNYVMLETGHPMPPSISQGEGQPYHRASRQSG